MSVLRLTYDVTLIILFYSTKNCSCQYVGRVKMLELLTPNEAARRMRVERITIYRWVKSSRLQAMRLPNGRIRIEAKEVDSLLTKIKG